MKTVWLKTKNTKTKHLGVHGYLFGHPVNHCICQCLITEITETENSEDREYAENRITLMCTLALGILTACLGQQADIFTLMQWEQVVGYQA